MSCGWEGNRRSGIGLAMRHRLEWFIHLRVQPLSKGDKQPTNTPYGVRYSLPLVEVPSIAMSVSAWEFLSLTKTNPNRRLTRRCFVESEYLRPRGTICRVASGCEWAAITYFMVHQSTPSFHYLVEECLWFNNPFLDWRYLGLFRSSASAKWKIDRNGGFRAAKF